MSQTEIAIEPLEQEENVEIVEKWRVISSKIQDVDGKIGRVEQEKQDLTLEHSILSQEIAALTESDEQSTSNYAQVSMLRKLQMEIDKYTRLAEHDEKRAGDLEEWCAMRSEKNHDHLTTLQRKAYDLRKRAFINEDSKVLPPVIKKKEMEISDLERKIEELVASNAMHSEVIDICSGLRDNLESMKKSQVEIIETESAVHNLGGQIDELKRTLVEKKSAVQENKSWLHDLEGNARETATNLMANVKEAREALDQLSMSDLDMLKEIRGIIDNANQCFAQHENLEVE